LFTAVPTGKEARTEVK